MGSEAAQFIGMGLCAAGFFTHLFVTWGDYPEKREYHTSTFQCCPKIFYLFSPTYKQLKTLADKDYDYNIAKENSLFREL